MQRSNQLTVGGTDPIEVTLTEAALRLLDGLGGRGSCAEATEHRALITTIVVGRAAEGDLRGHEVTIDAADLLRVLAYVRSDRP